MVSLVIPLREVTLVEPAENQSSTGADKSILVTTARSSFLFAQIHDRDFVVQKISELLAKFKLNYTYVFIKGDIWLDADCVWNIWIFTNSFSLQNQR